MLISLKRVIVLIVKRGKTQIANLKCLPAIMINEAQDVVWFEIPMSTFSYVVNVPQGSEQASHLAKEPFQPLVIVTKGFMPPPVSVKVSTSRPGKDQETVIVDLIGSYGFDDVSLFVVSDLEKVVDLLVKEGSQLLAIFGLLDSHSNPTGGRILSLISASMLITRVQHTYQLGQVRNMVSMHFDLDNLAEVSSTSRFALPRQAGKPPRIVEV